MNGRGGCCIARYGGDGGGYGMYGMSKVDTIMLKYRPIAPKPVATGSSSGSGGSTKENSSGYVKCVRSKRKYVRVNKNKINKKSNRKVTLSLLPEKPDRKPIEPVTGFPDLLTPVQTTKTDLKKSKTTSSPVWLSFNNQEQKNYYSHMVGHVNQVVTKQLQQTPSPQPRKPEVVSYVTVECVANTWVDVEGLGCTDEERVMNMEKDTCPGFISDGQDRVVWTNKAYRQMAGGDYVAVVLVRKEERTTLLPVAYPAFTCKVRVTISSAGAVDSHLQSLTVPCDVWRMDHGGCAWRLDVKAALSLGR
ncbi:uncharacterized protein [Rutidosis leptorrhynchoides]|uniref:uncharacterized protein n=1 Tax=Rutidosis leptorrhynchoides TaxID=125765 RepID=UPI003A98DE74